MKNPTNNHIGIYLGGLVFLCIGASLGWLFMNNIVLGFYTGLALFLSTLVVFAKKE